MKTYNLNIKGKIIAETPSFFLIYGTFYKPHIQITHPILICCEWVRGHARIPERAAALQSTQFPKVNIFLDYAYFSIIQNLINGRIKQYKKGKIKLM